MAGRFHTKNDLDISTNLHLKRIHKKDDCHTIHNQQFASIVELKGNKTAQLSLAAKRYTENKLDPITGTLTSQQQIEAGMTANSSHTLYMTANSTRQDKAYSTLNSRHGEANYSNGRASVNAVVNQITLQDKKNNQQTQGIWAKFCALGYRLLFSGSNSHKLDYSGQPANKQRQNVSIALIDDKKGQSLNIALSCTRKRHQGEFKIGFMFRNLLNKCKKKYTFKVSWKQCKNIIQEENAAKNSSYDISDHKTAVNSTIDLAASRHSSMMTTACTTKKTTHYKGNFKFFGYQCRMEYFESSQHNKNSIDISQQSMNDATMTASASA
ncbi:MAG: hypothetical protein GY821_18120 [Gammaproteobacteria bacterium]|nr:hypothetical protein [Gammaproteobacteria bacterium]